MRQPGAPGSTSEWFRRTLELLRQVVGFDAAYCYLIDGDLTSRPVELVNLDPVSLPSYVGRYAELDPFHPRRTAGCARPVVTLDDVDVPSADARAYAGEFLRPLGVGPEVEVLVRPGGRPGAGLSLLRRHGAAGFTGADVRVLGGVQPYVEFAWSALAPTPRPSGVSAREWEVAQLVAAGHSDKQIARRLAVSVPTVKTHLRHLYRKLGVGSRTAMVARLGMSHDHP